jgi:hypothetical protein
VGSERRVPGHAGTIAQIGGCIGEADIPDVNPAFGL